MHQMVGTVFSGVTAVSDYTGTKYHQINYRELWLRVMV